MSSTRLPASPRSAAAARRFLAGELGDLYEESLRDDALLLTSELVTNAVLHAHTGVELSVVTGMDGIHVEVTDASPEVPRQRGAPPELDALEGRGLALVAALAGDWGVRLAPPGKVVWFDLPAPKGKRVRRAAG
jgi:anti-sigma regulatory factor (Ser/Thr protein kinase)